MDSIRVSEAPDPGSIPGEATDDKLKHLTAAAFKCFSFYGLNN